MKDKSLQDFMINESSSDLSKFYREFSRYYRSGRKYSFREWIDVMGDLYDILD
jgi:hypothetical protein|tara:strand:- start:696 stop:854 length:159 start_codon:yes stop_codon:yes gene_type:complete